MASTIAVRPELHGRRVRLDDRALALSAYDGHHDRVRLRAVEPCVHLDCEPAEHPVCDAHRDSTVVALDHAKAAERVRMVVHAVPRVEAVGEHVARVARRLETDHRRERPRRTGRQDRRLRQPGLVVEAHPEQDAVVVAAEAASSRDALRRRALARARDRRASPPARGRRRGTRRGAGRLRARRAPDRRRATRRSPVRAPGSSAAWRGSAAIASTAYHPPAGSACARPSARWIQAALACSESGRASSKRGRR